MKGEGFIMNITDVRVRRVAKEGKMKAVVSITIDEEFVVHDIKVIEGEKGLFIAMPSRKATDGEYRDIAHPINSETREKIQGIILQKYEQVLAEEPVEAEQPDRIKRIRAKMKLNGMSVVAGIPFLLYNASKNKYCKGNKTMIEQLPKAFLERMKTMLGKEYEDFLKSYEAPRQFGLRVNTLKIFCRRNF